MKLKACPLCGGEANVESFDPWECLYWIVCKNCGSTGAIAETPGKAIEAWNRRVSDEGEKVSELRGGKDMGSAQVERTEEVLPGMCRLPLVQRAGIYEKGGEAALESPKEVHIEALIEDELDRIVKEHGYFSSDHEAYAVIKEEVEEVEEDLDNLQFCLEMFWEHVRNDDDNLENAEAIERNGIELIKETVQVIACCRKYKRGHLKDWLEKKAKRVGGQHDAD